MWNELPMELRSLKSLPRFKTNLKKYIISSRVEGELSTTEENIFQVDGNTELEDANLVLEDENWRMTTELESTDVWDDEFQTAGRTGITQPLLHEMVNEDTNCTLDELMEDMDELDTIY